MPRIATYVFFDTETTGLPAFEINRTRITELCLLAVKRDHLVSSPSAPPPRVQHKLTLCLYPRKQVSEEAVRLTGLSNELLEDEPVFDLEVYRLLNSFLAILTAPVCLVAHNGLGFDYPILRNHLQKLAVGFAENLLCADSFHGFYDILEKRKLMAKVEMPAAESEKFIPQGLLSLTGVLWGCSNPFIRAGTQGLRDVQAATWGGQAWAEASFLLGNWRYVVPWLVNQGGSLLYLWGVQRAPLSLAVPLANGLAFACTALVGALSGHEEPLHRGSILGIALIVAGIALCCLDKTS